MSKIRHLLFIIAILGSSLIFQIPVNIGTVAAVIAVVFFVVGGYFLLTAGGNSNQVTKGWGYMRNAIIGLLVVILSFSIVQITVGVLNSFL